MVILGELQADNQLHFRIWVLTEFLVTNASGRQRGRAKVANAPPSEYRVRENGNVEVLEKIMLVRVVRGLPLNGTS